MLFIAIFQIPTTSSSKRSDSTATAAVQQQQSHRKEALSTVQIAVGIDSTYTALSSSTRSASISYGSTLVSSANAADFETIMTAAAVPHLPSFGQRALPRLLLTSVAGALLLCPTTGTPARRTAAVVSPVKHWTLGRQRPASSSGARDLRMSSVPSVGNKSWCRCRAAMYSKGVVEILS